MGFSGAAACLRWIVNRELNVWGICSCFTWNQDTHVSHQKINGIYEIINTIVIVENLVRLIFNLVKIVFLTQTAGYFQTNTCCTLIKGTSCWQVLRKINTTSNLNLLTLFQHYKTAPNSISRLFKNLYE